MRCWVIAALAGASMLAASQASAKQYYYCYIEDFTGKTLERYTPILSTDVEEIDDRQTGFAFSEFVGSFDNNASHRTGCTSSSKLSYLEKNYQGMLANAAGAGIKVNWPNPPVPSQVAVASPNEVSITFGDSKTSPPAKRAVPTKYVEVAGPSGTIRLSPEVAARNQAAAEEYRRKMEGHAREKADHDRKLAEYKESIARAKRALQDHGAQLGAQQEEHQKQLREQAARVEARDSDTPCARYRRSNGAGWKVNPCV